MKSNKILRICSLIFIATLTNVFAQDPSFSSIHKLVEAKKFREAIPQLREFIEKEKKHVPAHYDLALCYDGIVSEIVKEQNANVNFQRIDLWQDSDYQKNLALWNKAINAMDSAIFFYKLTSELMNIKFLTLDLRYDEFYQATKDCDALSKVKCARAFLAKIIEQREKTNAQNKSKFFNEEKNYEAFKRSQQSKSVVTNTSNDNFIKEGAVDNLFINGKISVLAKEYSVKKTIEYGEEASEFTVFELSKNNNLLFKLTPVVDSNYEATDNIAEITVISPLYKTNKGIGVGSSIQDIIKTYPNYFVRYSYITGRFEVEVQELKNVRFEIDKNGYIGSQDKLMDGDMVELSIKEFKPNSQIIAVRIF
jgi:hypothetical protein